MRYTKNITFLILFAFWATYSIGQTNVGFAKDIRIDTAGNFLKDSFFLKSQRPYVTDYGGSHISQGFLFRDIDLSAYELLVANLSFSDKDQVQKINFQPFKLINAQIPTVITNIKLNIVQKKDITTFGIGVGGDNSLPNSVRGNRLREKVFQKQLSPPGINRDVSKFDNRRSEINKMDIDQKLKDILIAQVNGEQKVYDETLFDIYVKTVLTPFKTTLDDLLLSYDEERAHSVFKWTIGYNTQMFSIFSAKGAANNFDSLNYYSQKANVISGTANYSFDRGWFIVSASYNYINSRKNAIKNFEKIRYDGYSFAMSKRIVSFLSDESLKKHPAYVKSLFIPSISGGIIWELKKTNEANLSFIEDGIKRQRVLTPFIDILLAPAAQFRISLPFQKNVLVDGSKQSFLGATVQYGLKFSNLN